MLREEDIFLGLEWAQVAVDEWDLVYLTNEVLAEKRLHLSLRGALIGIVIRLFDI